jgi:hypothetical protein
MMLVAWVLDSKIGRSGCAPVSQPVAAAFGVSLLIQASPILATGERYRQQPHSP